MAGYWALSRTQILDQNDNLIPGALAYFFEAGTSTPMTVYSSVTLGVINEHSHPVVADGNARWPQVFFDDVAFQFYRVRVTDAGGSLIYDDDSVPIIGQAEGGGGGEPPVPIDQTGLARTGDIKAKFALQDDTETGWVRCNGGTISKSGSGGSEAAGDHAQALFVHLWEKSTNAILPLAGGAARGLTALADFNAGRQLTVPDLRGRSLFGIDTTIAPTGRIAATYIDTGSITAPGSVGGDDDIVLVANNLAKHSHDATGVPAIVGPPAVPALPGLKMPAHSHLMVDDFTSGTETDPLTATKPIMERGFLSSPELTYQLVGGTTANIGKTSTQAITDITGNTGLNVTTSAAHENMPPFMLLTFYIKL